MPQFERDGVEFNVTLDGPENAPPLMLSNSLGTICICGIRRYPN